jgi:hypothetical protein
VNLVGIFPMALRWIIIFLSLLICSALDTDKEKPSKLICEIRKFGVFSVGECLPDFVMCDNGLDFVDKCQDGYFFDETDMLCKTPNEIFCNHLVTDKSERSCDFHRAALLSPADESLSDAGPLNANHQSDRVGNDEAVKVASFSSADESLSDAGPLFTTHQGDGFVLAQPIQAVKFSKDSLSNAGPFNANHESGRVGNDEAVKVAPFSPADESLFNAGPLNANHQSDRVDNDEAVKVAPFSPAYESLFIAGPLNANHQSDRVGNDKAIKNAPFFPADVSLSNAGPLNANHQSDRVGNDESVKVAPFSPADVSLSNAGPLNANHENDRVGNDEAVKVAPFSPTDESLSNAGPLSLNYQRPKYHRVVDEFDRSEPIGLQNVFPLETPVVDRFDGVSVPGVLNNPFVHPRNIKELHDDFARGLDLEIPAVSPFKTPSKDSPVLDRFKGRPITQVLNNAFVHFSEKLLPKKYQRNVQLSDAPLKEGSGTEDEEDVGLFWRSKRSVDLKCPIKQYSYRPMFRRSNVTSSRIPRIRTVNDSVSLTSLREMFESAPDAPPAVDPQCNGRENGYTYSNGLCRSTYHRCFHGAKIRHSCALTGQVFDDVKKICVSRADLLECRPPKQLTLLSKSEFDLTDLCKNHADGLYRHPNSCHRIIHCFGNETFERPPCDHELAFDERRGICDYRQNVPGCENYADGSTSNKNPQSVIGCNGAKHGDYVPIKNECNSFYRCVWDILERMKCPSGTVFNPKINVCDYPNRVQCNAAN